MPYGITATQVPGMSKTVPAIPKYIYIYDTRTDTTYLQTHIYSETWPINYEPKQKKL
jgi:hypothetical protein